MFLLLDKILFVDLNSLLTSGFIVHFYIMTLLCNDIKWLLKISETLSELFPPTYTTSNKGVSDITML